MATRKDKALIENALRLAYERGEMEIPCPDTSSMVSLRFRIYAYTKALRLECETLGVKSDGLVVAEAVSISIDKETNVLTLQRKDREQGMMALERALEAAGKVVPDVPTLPSEEAEALARVEALARQDGTPEAGHERATPYYKREE
jgi:hypothetical protein